MTRLGAARRLILLGSVVTMVAGSRAIAATAAMMTIDSTQQGAVTGSVQGKVKGNKPAKGGPPAIQIELLSVTRAGGSDVASGAAVRKNSTPGLTVTKAYDSNSAILEEAAATNQILRQVTIVFETAAPTGKGTVAGSSAKGSKAASGMAASGTSKTAQVLVLKNVQITVIEQTRNIQQISLEYQSIEVTNTTGKTTATDDWETP